MGVVTMTDWFRSWHGAPTDPKWLGIARRAGVAPGIAVAVSWALMDRASQAGDRGSIEGYDAEGLAYFFGCEPEQVDAIVDAMADKGMISDGRFAAWEKRQPKREDDASERTRAWRERKRAQGDAVERTVTHRDAPDTDTDTDKKQEPTGSSKKRGARLPDDFQPDMAAADEAGLSQADAGREALKFRDYWISQPGQRGVKLDWPATWRNWCRTAAERRPSQRSTSPPKKPTIGDMFRQDAQRMGVIPNDQITSPPDRRLADRDARGEGSGSGIARRFALPANLLGDVGQS